MQRISAFCLVALLAACGATEQEGARPVDVPAEAATFYQENPGTVAALLNDRGKGFEIYEDGKAYFVAFRAISDLRIRTGVSSMEGNQICFREQNNWSGACMRLYENPDGTYFAEGKFGSGASINETFTLTAIPPR